MHAAERDYEIFPEFLDVTQALYLMPSSYPFYELSQRLAIGTLINIQRRPRKCRIHYKRKQGQFRTIHRPAIF